MSVLHVVLVEPEIPANTGNIARTCAATHTALHLIRPLGFSLDDRYLRRAGLDYWPAVDVHVHDNWESYRRVHPHMRPFLTTTRARQLYTSVSYEGDVALVFGKETAGLPQSLVDAHPCLRLPMGTAVRSLNVSNAVAIVLYEALRQRGFHSLL